MTFKGGDMEEQVGNTSKDTGFGQELRKLINRHSLEEQSNTQDWLLAEFLVKCLCAYEDTVNERDAHRGLQARAEKAEAHIAFLERRVMLLQEGVRVAYQRGLEAGHPDSTDWMDVDTFLLNIMTNEEEIR